MNVKSERGVVAIEAALSLTLFMFAMITVFSMYHICLAQARISAALNSVAKEISQFSYVYAMTGLNDKQADLSNEGGATQSVLSDNLSEVNTVFDAIGGLVGTVVSASDNADSFIAYTLNTGVEVVKAGVVGEMARGLMRKHFGDNPDKFLRSLGIEDGMSGLHFLKTRIFPSGKTDDIMLNVRYQVTVIKLLNIDIKFNFELCAKTKAWTP